MHEVIRMPQKRYDSYVEYAKKICAYRTDPSEKRRGVIFTAMNSYPDAERLREEWPKMDARESIPFLIFYSRADIFDIPGDEKLEETRKAAKELLDDCLDVIDDEEYKDIEAVSPSAWKKMSIEAKTALFEGLIGYYGREEFDTFMKDLGYMKFMKAYGLTAKQYRDGETSAALLDTFREIWDKAQSYTVF